MDVSVVIPIYQRQRQGERALRSVLAQSGPLREVILVDDASHDPFVVPADLKMDARIRLIRHERNLGESGARNTGIASASSDWIAFLDSDDYWLPGKLAGQTEFAMCDQDTKADPLVFYATGFIRNKLGIQHAQLLFPIDSDRVSDFASGCWFMPGSTVLFNKQLAEAAGPWDTSLRRSNDLDWYLSAALGGGRLRVAPIVGAVIEIGSRPNREVVDFACRQLTKKWISTGSPKQLGAVERRALAAYFDVERAAAARASGNYFSAARFLVRSFLRAQRSRVHLRKWWRSAPNLYGGGGNGSSTTINAKGKEDFTQLELRDMKRMGSRND